mgnify:CR=1 FL=1
MIFRKRHTGQLIYFKCSNKPLWVIFPDFFSIRFIDLKKSLIQFIDAIIFEYFV